MTDAVNSKPKKQPLWPLFLVASALGVFGFLMAFLVPVTEGVSDPVLPVPAPKFELSKNKEGFTPTVQLAPRSLRFWIKQKTIAGENTVSSETSFLAKDVVQDGQILRSVEDARIKLDGDNGRVELEVARLVETIQILLDFGPNGDLKSQQIVSAEAGQLARVVELIRGAQFVLVPNFPGGTISSGRTWNSQYRIAKPKEKDETETEDLPVFTGNLNVKRTLTGVADGRAFIKQIVTQSILREGDKIPLMRISGSGFATVDEKTGEVLESRMILQSSFKGDEPVSIATELVLIRE